MTKAAQIAGTWADVCGQWPLVSGPAVFSFCLRCLFAATKGFRVSAYKLVWFAMILYSLGFLKASSILRAWGWPTCGPTMPPKQAPMMTQQWRLELVDVTLDPPPELQLPTPAPVTVPAVPEPAPAAGFTPLFCIGSTSCYVLMIPVL